MLVCTNFEDIPELTPETKDLLMSTLKDKKKTLLRNTKYKIISKFQESALQKKVRGYQVFVDHTKKNFMVSRFYIYYFMLISNAFIA